MVVEMREFFTIKTGNAYQDENLEELILYYDRQKVCYGLMLAGAILLLYSIL
jgi:hypothetical protein